MLRLLIIALLIYSCTSTPGDLQAFRSPHHSHSLHYWDLSDEDYKKIYNTNTDTAHDVKAEVQAALEAHTAHEWDNLELVWPTSGTLTSSYGMRKLRHKTRMHQGIDIGARVGTPIYAAENGRVKFNGRIRGYGKAIILKHDSVHDTLYAHLSRIVVRSNQIVKKNQLIGYVGRTGYVTGPNLHFEMRVNGIAKDPLNFLPKTHSGTKRIRVGESITVKNRHIATQSDSHIHPKS